MSERRICNYRNNEEIKSWQCIWWFTVHMLFSVALSRYCARTILSYSISSAILYCTVLYCTVLYCTLLYCTVLVNQGRLMCLKSQWRDLHGVTGSRRSQHRHLLERVCQCCGELRVTRSIRSSIKSSISSRSSSSSSGGVSGATTVMVE